MRTLVTWGVTGAVAGFAIAVLMISIVQLRPFSVSVNSFIERMTFWLCPLYILGFSTDVTSKTALLLITFAGNALLCGLVFVLVAQAVALFRKLKENPGGKAA